MDQQRYRRLKDLTQQALEMKVAERTAFLERECGDDTEMLAEILALLSHEQSDGDNPSLTVTFTPDLPDLSGRTVGRYKIIQPIGEGGMGVVYLASQSAPLRRKVALKVIKLGMDTREVIARFSAERQALALMDHPNIAKVLDAGSTEEGRPFFVMEYIQGVPLLHFCEHNALGLSARLDLFIQVCRGIQHAHQKGVIHRDIKPGNILVTEQEGKPVPKIIDFGVAKAVGAHLAGQTVFTQQGRMIGTPEYMSPEQADPSGMDVDTRSDVYSLGVVLYELLTGVLPLERREILRAGFEQMALSVAEWTPAKPSTRLHQASTTQGKKRTTLVGVDTRLWEKRVRGDLDWITMKALEKERDRRYGSPAALVEDIERHLENQPVTAGPPSGLYRARKFVKRNRVGVTAASVLLAAIVGIGVWQTVQSQIIARERDRALANERLSYAREQVGKDPTVAIAYALSSLEIMDQPAARSIVRQAVAHGPLRDEIPRGELGGNPTWIDVSPDGKSCLVPVNRTEFNSVGIFNLEDYSLRILTTELPGSALRVVYNSDGRYACAITTGGIHVWRVADGEHVLHLPSVAEYFSSHVFRQNDPSKLAVCVNPINEPTRWFELDLQEGTLTESGTSRGLQQDQAFHLPFIDPAASRILDYDGQDIFLQNYADLDSDRSTLVGSHEAPITSVAMNPSCDIAVSADETGRIKVWDLAASPPQLSREFQEPAGTWFLRFDPHGQRFLTIWGSGTARLHDLAGSPEREPIPFMDRTYWAHCGAFMPDGTVVTSRGGVGSGPVAVWGSGDPMAWALDLEKIPGLRPLIQLSNSGDSLFLWTNAGEILSMPLVADSASGIKSNGRAGGWYQGLWQNFLVDETHDRSLTCSANEGIHILDMTEGTPSRLPGFDGSYPLWGLSPSGRFALIGDFEEPAILHVFDIDSMRVDQEFNLGHDNFQIGSNSYGIFHLSSDTSLLAMDEGHIARYDLSSPEAAPDTLWRGDASMGKFFLDEGRSAVVRDGDYLLSWIDLTSGRSVELAQTPRKLLQAVDFDPGKQLLAVGGWSGDILVFDLAGGRSWTIPARKAEQKYVLDVQIDPRGRWLMTSYDDQIVAWKLPLDPLFEELEYDDLLESLRARTNVRVVPNQTESGGFRISSEARR